MAGFYPDAPATRLAYDIDGSKCLLVNTYTNEIRELTSQEKTNINDESEATYFVLYPGSTSSSVLSRMVIIFPEPIYLYAYKVNITYGTYGGWSMEYSTDTKNGVDGTWTSISPTTSGSVSAPGYRTLTTTTAPNTSTQIRAVRVSITSGWSNSIIFGFHVYGNRASAQKFVFCDSAGIALGPAYFDFGDVAQGSNSTKTFYLENVSGATINGVNLSTSVLTDKTPSIVTQHLFSTDNATWTQTLSLGNINNGTRFGPIYFKRNTAANAALSLYAGRIKVSWT